MKSKSLSYFGYGLILLFLISTGCKKSSEVVKEPVLKSEDLLEVRYADHPQNSMDIYLPAQRNSATPVILFVHGGFWFEGDKSMFTDLAKYMRDAGYVSANINYRLTHTAENNVHPAQVNDIAKAIGFLKSKASEYKISPSAYALLGASSGAHLALLYTYQDNRDNLVKTVVSMAGPANFADPRNANPLQAQVLEWFIGSSFQSNPTAYVQASPITHVSSTSKPTLIFHGKLDVVVPSQQSIDLKAKLDQFNVPNKLIVYDNLGHEFAGTDKSPAFLAEIESWLSLYLK
jgi:acetyl esterase/lipase